MFTRERHRRGIVYFGPYASAKKVRETLDVLNRVFQFRPCEGPQPGRHSGIPCLDYHIERCLAPCVGYDLEGGVPRADRRCDRLPLRRDAADPALAGAADARGGRATARSRRPPATATGSSRSSPRRAPGGGPAGGRHGRRDRPRGRRQPRRRPGLPAPRRQAGRPARLPPRERRGPGRGDPRRGLLPRVLRRPPSVPPLLIVPPGAADTEALQGFLSERAGLAVEVRAARRGEKRRLAGARARNAELALAERGTAAERKRLRRIEALEELREALNLESLPIRIECFDISNMQDGRRSVDGRVPGRRGEEGPLPEVRGSGTSTGRTTSR